MDWTWRSLLNSELWTSSIAIRFRSSRGSLSCDVTTGSSYLKRDYPDSAINLGEAKRNLQRRVTSLKVDLAWHEFFSEMPTHERAQRLSQASPGASAFLSVVPSLPELSLSTAELRISQRRWLRLPFLKNIPSGPCSPTRHAPALSSDHLLTCRNEGMLRRRLNNLRRTLRDMATTAGLIAKRGARGASLDSAKVVAITSFMISTLDKPLSRMSALSLSMLTRWQRLPSVAQDMSRAGRASQVPKIRASLPTARPLLSATGH